MLSAFLEQARSGEPIWVPDLRVAFAADDSARPLYIRLHMHDDSQRDFFCPLPHCSGSDEASFIAEYFYACIYNILAAYSGRCITVFFDTQDKDLSRLVESLDSVFQLHSSQRQGYGKVLNIADRISRYSCGTPFSFIGAALSEYKKSSPISEPPAHSTANLAERLRKLCSRSEKLMLCGVDVGGSDIKLAASCGCDSLFTKVFDWNPSSYKTPEELTDPIFLLIRLMRICLSSTQNPLPPNLQHSIQAALNDTSDLQSIHSIVDASEAFLGSNIDVLDGIGLSFPDIVINDHILGGETPKTQGMHSNKNADYEVAFSKLFNLKSGLQKLCRPGGLVHIVNDGNMAAFTAAVMVAHTDLAGILSDGIFAHSLGTDLGTGWITAEGTIPAIPLEMYNLILDIGNYPSRAYPPEDLRSTRNDNSGLSGAQRYLGQAAAYRLAQKYAPSLLERFTEEKNGTLHISLSPEDLRKPCLEHLMDSAEAGDSGARSVFLNIGANLSVVSREIDYLIHPPTKNRFLFGRFVKRPSIFSLLEEGYRSAGGSLCLVSPDENLASTPLMHLLSQTSESAVAQYGQAVGAIYFALS